MRLLGPDIIIVVPGSSLRTLEPLCLWIKGHLLWSSEKKWTVNEIFLIWHQHGSRGPLKWETLA
jgi:hypothetical protein